MLPPEDAIEQAVFEFNANFSFSPCFPLFPWIMDIYL